MSFAMADSDDLLNHVVNLFRKRLECKCGGGECSAAARVLGARCQRAFNARPRRLCPAVR